MTAAINVLFAHRREKLFYEQESARVVRQNMAENGAHNLRSMICDCDEGYKRNESMQRCRHRDYSSKKRAHTAA